MVMEDKKKAMVILDVDGVLNSYSNHRFYMKFIMRSLRGLSKVHGKKKLFTEIVNLKKHGGANGLFVFAKKYCGDDAKYDKFCYDLMNTLNYDCISYDPSMKKMMERLSSLGNICIRSDGLDDMARAVWMRVIENKPSSEIKTELRRRRTEESDRIVEFCGKKVWFSGIEDNEFKLKKDKESWKIFSNKHKVDIEKSVLLDDSKKNLNVAQSLGMTTVHISALDSFLQKSKFGTVFGWSLTDVLGEKLSKTLEKYSISYGKKVNVSELFKTIFKKTTKTDDRVLGESKKSNFDKSR